MMLSVCSGVYSLCKEVKKMPHKVPHTHSSTETCLSLEKDARVCVFRSSTATDNNNTVSQILRRPQKFKRIYS